MDYTISLKLLALESPMLPSISCGKAFAEPESCSKTAMLI